MTDKHSSDLENVFDDKAAKNGITYTDDRLGSVHEEIARARQIQNAIAPLRVLRQGEEWLDAKLGIETQGIDRIPEEAKRPPSIINTFFIWWSVTVHVGTLPIGFLGPEFGLSLGQSVAGIVVGTFLGALCTAYTGTLGPKVSHMRLCIPYRELMTYDSLVYAKSPALDTPLVSGVPNWRLSSISSSVAALPS